MSNLSPVSETANAPLPTIGSGRFWPLVNAVRLVLAIICTLTLFPYAWGYTLIVYSRWGWDRQTTRYVEQLFVGIAVVILLNFHVGRKLSSKRFAKLVLPAVLVLWTAVIVSMIVAYNGPLLSTWLVLAGFYPAGLWVVWLAWMFFTPIRWPIRVVVLALLLLAVAPFVHFFEVRDMMGSTRVNFRIRGHGAEPVLVSKVGELSGQGISLSSNGDNDFPGFQGAGRDAVLPGVKLDRNWESHPPRQLWRKPVGQGWSGFAVVGNYAFTQEQRGNLECVICRDLATGAEVWVHQEEAPFKNQPRYDGMGGPGPRCTPTIYEGTVYTVGATGILNCLEGRTGHVVWSKNIITTNGGDVAGHGVCGSPLIIQDMVIVAPTCTAQASLAAYDRHTGKGLWVAGVHPAGYSSPMLAVVDSTPQILNYTAKGVTAHDPTVGTVLWDFEWTNTQDVVCSQPIAPAGAPNQVLLTNGYDKGSVLLKVAHASSVAWTASSIWTSRRMKTKFTTAVLCGKSVYGLDDGIMECMDLETGEAKWKNGRYGHGQILLVGELILVQTESGPVALIEANPEKLVELGKIPALSSKTWNCPALAGKHLLVRNDTEAACYELALR